MNSLVAANIGSGTLGQTRAILPALQRGSEPLGEGLRVGNQVMVGNFEDNVAVDAFAASGITVGTVAVEIVGPYNNPMPRSRQVVIQNTGGQSVYLSHKSDFPTLDSFELVVGGTAGTNRRVTLPILHNVSVYAKTTTGTSVVRLLIL